MKSAITTHSTFSAMRGLGKCVDALTCTCSVNADTGGGRGVWCVVNWCVVKMVRAEWMSLLALTVGGVRFSHFWSTMGAAEA
jgi:hypothetical protein